MVLLLLILMVLPFMFYGVCRRNVYTLEVLTVFCFFQNLVLVIISPYIDKGEYNQIVIMKEVYMALCIIVSCICERKRRLTRTEMISYISILLLSFWSFVAPGGTMMQVLISFRQLYLVFVFFVFARTIRASEKDVVKFIRFFCCMCIIACLFGLVELIIGDSFWQTLNYRTYSLIKGGRQSIINGFYNSIAMYSYDLFFITHSIVKRVGATLVDPVIFSQLLALAFLFLFFVKDLFKRQRLWMVLVGITLVLTIGKGGIVIAGFSFAIIIKKVYKKRKTGNLLLIASSIVFVWALIQSISEGTSGSIHLNGLLDNLREWINYPMGRGVGSMGNLVRNMTESDSEINGESFIGT